MTRDAVSYFGMVLSLVAAAVLTLAFCHLRDRARPKPAALSAPMVRLR